MSNLEKELKNIKIKNTLSKESQISNWDELEKKYINYNNSDMSDMLFKGKKSVKPKWFISLMFSLAAVLVVVFPVSAYLTIPTFQESVNSLLKIEDIEKGTLIVESSTDESFSVFINGEYKGETPLTKELPEGNYSVRLYKEGFEEKFISVNITGDQISKIQESLLSLNSDPFQGWLSYRNETLGFGFRYPRTWNITESIGDDTDVYEVDLSYTYSDDSERNIYCKVTYTENDIRAYDEENFTFEDIDYGSAGKGIERKVGDTLVDSLKFACSYNPDYDEDKTITEKWTSSISFVNRTVANNSIDEDVLYNVNTKVKAPQSSQGNYILAGTDYDQNDRLNDIKILNTNDGTIENAGYSLPIARYIVDPNGKFVIYTENAVVFAKDLANGRTVELFRSKNEDSIIFDFVLREISNDSKYMVYSLDIRDISECLGHDGLCPGNHIEERFGWKSGLYVYDLDGNLGNIYLPEQPFDFSNYLENCYTIDWFGNDSIFYIFDYANNEVYKYEATEADFEFSEKLGLEGKYSYSNLDMWNDEFGVVKVFDPELLTFELLCIREKDNMLVKVTEINIDAVMNTTGDISGFKLFEMNGNIYFFVNNSVWMYSAAGFEDTDDSWKSFKYVYFPTVGETSTSNRIYYPTDKDNLVVAVEQRRARSEKGEFEETFVFLFDPIAMTAPVTFQLSDGIYTL